MSRPSRAMPQMDDTGKLSQAMTWRAFFQPDATWLDRVNTTNYRTVNAIRMFVGVTLLFSLVFMGVVSYALTRCGILVQLFGMRIFQLLPPPGRLTVGDWRLCEESLATARMLDFASTLFNSYSLLLAAMAGIALGAMAVKRLSDTEHQERVQLAKAEVERAKKAPVILPVTGEHQPPIQQTTVTVGDEVTAHQRKPTGDARVDDERGE